RSRSDRLSPAALAAGEVGTCAASMVPIVGYEIHQCHLTRRAWQTEVILPVRLQRIWSWHEYVDEFGQHHVRSPGCIRTERLVRRGGQPAAGGPGRHSGR